MCPSQTWESCRSVINIYKFKTQCIDPITKWEENWAYKNVKAWSAVEKKISSQNYLIPTVNIHITNVTIQFVVNCFLNKWKVKWGLFDMRCRENPHYWKSDQITEVIVLSRSRFLFCFNWKKVDIILFLEISLSP